MKCQGAQKDKETSQERDDGGCLTSEGDHDGDEEEITRLILTTILWNSTYYFTFQMDKTETQSKG